VDENYSARCADDERQAMIDSPKRFIYFQRIRRIKNSARYLSRPSASNTHHLITELFLRQVRMNRNMELQYQIEYLQRVAVVNCSGRMVRGAALDQFRHRIEQLDRVSMLILDVSEVDHLDAGGLGTLLLIRRWATQKNARMKLVNPPVFFRRILEATHLNSVFEISSLKEAICILRTSPSSKDCAPQRFAVA
jgi:anti-anti-sigma factor